MKMKTRTTRITLRVKIEKIAMIGFEILTWIRSIDAYHTFGNQRPGLDKSLKEKEVFVPPSEQLKETKVRQYVFQNDKRQAESNS